ncbi:MAG: hypothetical protein QNJ31_07035 [Candidatus Caenarcaniphilales bacterium]|nr:hypothetical protein [Candidatus Caenarcaniphilales bacterium]
MNLSVQSANIPPSYVYGSFPIANISSSANKKVCNSEEETKEEVENSSKVLKESPQYYAATLNSAKHVMNYQDPTGGHVPENTQGNVGYNPDTGKITPYMPEETNNEQEYTYGAGERDRLKKMQDPPNIFTDPRQVEDYYEKELQRGEIAAEENLVKDPYLKISKEVPGATSVA